MARPSGGGKGVGGKGLGVRAGKGIGKGLIRRRQRKILKDTIHGISKGEIKRMARRGGVKRISAQIYEDTRAALRDYLTGVLKDVVIYTEHANRKTVTVADVVFALRRRGRPIYGFGEDRRAWGIGGK